MPALRPSDRTRAGAGVERFATSPFGTSRRWVAATVLAVGLAGALAAPASAQVDPDPEPTTTVAPTTVAPTTVAPTTVAPTTVAPTAPPTTFATTQRPVVTTAPPTTAVQPVVTAPASTTSSTAATTTSSAPTTASTAPALVEATETVDTEPVAETEGISSTTKLRMVVAGLIAIAVIVAILTFVYWRKTRPYAWEEWDEDEELVDEERVEGDPAPAAPPDATAVVAAAAPAVDRAPPAPTASAPVVPSLIDPALRARVEGTAPSEGSLGDTQALPVVTLDDGADRSTGSPATGPAAPTESAERWGESRVPPAITTDDDRDPDAPFRPPSR